MDEEYSSDTQHVSVSIKHIRSLLKNTNGAIIAEDHRRRVVFANDSFCDLFCPAMSPQDLTGQHGGLIAEQLQETFDNSESFRKRIDRIVASREPVSNEICRLGSDLILERDYIPIVLGKRKGHLWVYRNITSCEYKQEDIQGQEALFSAMFTEHSACMLLIDPFTGAIVDANPSSCQFYGYDRDEITSMCIQDINVLPKGSVENRMRLSKEKQKNEFIFDHRRSDGSVRKVKVHSSPIQINEDKFLFSIVRDVTHQVKSRDILTKEVDKLKRLFKRSRDAIVTCGKDGIIQEVNEKACSLFQYSRQDIVGKHIKVLHAPSQKKQMEVNFDEVIEKGGLLFDMKLKKRNGSTFWANISSTYIELDSGALIVGIIRDVTKRYRALSQVEKEKKKTEKTLQERKQLISSISHDIRNPLNALMLSVQSLQKEAGAKVCSNKVERIDASSKIINQLIQDLSYQHDAENSYTNRWFQVSNLQKLVDNVFSSTDKNLDFINRLDLNFSGEIMIHGDEARIFQIVHNLVRNAIKYTHEGKVKVELGLEVPRGVYFTVQDTGVGISEHDQKRVFEAFERANHADGTPGKGLGLTIVKDLVTEMGGWVKVESEVGQGTLFNVFLPLDYSIKSQKRSDILKSQQDKENLGRFKGKRVLVVDDERMSREALADLLRTFAMSTDAVGTGAEALTQVRKASYDLILLDLNMPEMSGYEVAKRIRSTQPHAHTGIIAITAASAQEIQERLSSSGIDLFVSKPVDRQTLISSIDSCLGKDSERRTPKQSIKRSPQEGKSFSFDFIRQNISKDSKTVLYYAKMFVSEMEGMLETLHSAERDASKRKILHRMKSPSRMLKANKLTAAIKHAESQQEITEENVRAVSDEATSLLNDVTSYLKKIDKK